MIEEKLLQEATRILVKGFRPEKIILFGSQARGTADDRSDVDLLIVCRIEGKKRDVMVAMDRALRGVGIARDIVVMSAEEFERDRHIPGCVARPASREGRVLYAGIA